MTRPPLKTTHTEATLGVTANVYFFIASELRNAGYIHSFNEDGTISMTGIRLENLEAGTTPSLAPITSNPQVFAGIENPVQLIAKTDDPATKAYEAVLGRRATDEECLALGVDPTPKVATQEQWDQFQRDQNWPREEADKNLFGSGRKQGLEVAMRMAEEQVADIRKISVEDLESHHLSTEGLTPIHGYAVKHLMKVRDGLMDELVGTVTRYASEYTEAASVRQFVKNGGDHTEPESESMTEAVDEALIANGLDIKGPNESNKEALARLVSGEVTMALDPAISYAAALLQMQGRQAGIELSMGIIHKHAHTKGLGTWAGAQAKLQEAATNNEEAIAYQKGIVKGEWDYPRTLPMSKANKGALSLLIDHARASYEGDSDLQAAVELLAKAFSIQFEPFHVPDQNQQPLDLSPTDQQFIQKMLDTPTILSAVGSTTTLALEPREGGLFNLKEVPNVKARSLEGLIQDDVIRDEFLYAGFTIKEGQTDLKTYVYDAAYAILAKQRDYTKALTKEALKDAMGGDAAVEEMKAQLANMPTLIQEMEASVATYKEGVAEIAAALQDSIIQLEPLRLWWKEFTILRPDQKDDDVVLEVALTGKDPVQVTAAQLRLIFGDGEPVMVIPVPEPAPFADIAPTDQAYGEVGLVKFHPHPDDMPKGS